jgi:hypothetical protein
VWEAEGNPPLWAWTRAVRQLTGRADVLDVGQTDASAASFRQTDALLEALGRSGPAVLALDDLHWADAGSLRLLRRLSAELDRVPLLLVLATRDAPPRWGPCWPRPWRCSPGSGCTASTCPAWTPRTSATGSPSATASP